MRTYRMTDGFSCGPRSLQIALSFFNIFPSYDDLLCECRTEDLTGTSTWDLYKAAKSYDLETKQHDEKTSVDLLIKYLDKNAPVIILWYAGEIEGEKLNHFSVAYKHDDKFIYMLDPAMHLYAEPEIRMRIGNLKRAWTTYPKRKWMMAILGKNKK